MTLKPIDTLHQDELEQVTTPFYALGQLKSARQGHSRIQGFDSAWEICTNNYGSWDGNRRTHGFEQLCTHVENGDWVLVLDRSWPPLCPAYYQANGQWQVSRHVWETTARRQLESQAQTLQRQQREQKAFQSQHLPSSATEPQTESASGSDHTESGNTQLEYTRYIRR